jgi:hypothetical protein
VNAQGVEYWRNSLLLIALPALRKGIEGFLWMLKIFVPTSFAIMILEYAGVISTLDNIFAPVMQLFNLPAMAVLPLITGALTGILSGIAIMSVLPFTPDQMTLIAVFLLISHNLIQEGIIQWKSGLHFLAATVFRIGSSALTLLLVAKIIEAEAVEPALVLYPSDSTKSLVDLLGEWCLNTSYFCLKIFAIIMGVMILFEFVKHQNVTRRLVLVMRPLTRILGLSSRSGLLWLTAAIFGLGYGGAVIVQEAAKEDLGGSELRKLQMSIGINHAMIDEPAIFLCMGLNPVWLWIPRICAAIVIVWSYSAWLYVKTRVCCIKSGKTHSLSD